ncbi:MAG TPA: TonB-dependent receptor plug domain-containing protein, partial [Gammaproteobacteria bacterium]|nr:TonB-dependent receptor plug domain-containing protein [Gammaproteobacteria bacterium]
MAIGAVLGCGGAASAQEGQSRELLEEIIVTAQFREENVQQTPIAISAYDATMLEARSNSDIADAANFAPNVTLSNAATGFGQMSSIFIRGVG